MDYSTRCILFAAALFIIPTFISCVTTDRQGHRNARCKVAAEAVDCLYQVLPKNVTLEEKCKRYAVISTIIISQGQALHKAAMFLTKLDESEVDLLYRQIDEADLVTLYMNIIEEYKITTLRPPFLDLIECLGRLNQPHALLYISNRELILIAYLYELILRTPTMRIDMDHINLSEFHPSFQARLKELFSGHLKGDTIHKSQYDEIHSHAKTQFLMSLRQQELKRRREDHARSNVDPQQDLRREKRRIRNRERSRRLRIEDTEKCRELDRLRQRRLRMTKPDVVRARERIRQQRRRDKVREDKKQQLEQLLGQPSKQPQQQDLYIQSQWQRLQRHDQSARINESDYESTETRD